MVTHLLRRRLLPSRIPKTLLAAASPPRRSFIPSDSSLPTLRFLRLFSASGRADLDGFRELLARAEWEKQRWDYRRSKAGEKDSGDKEVGMDAVVERFERLAESWGGRSGKSGAESGDSNVGGAEETERLDLEGVFERYRMLLEGCAKADTPDDVHKWMAGIDNIEEKYLSMVMKCRNGQKMLDELNIASEEERPFIIQKISHMVELNRWKDPCADHIVKEKDSKRKQRELFFNALQGIEFLKKKQRSNSLGTKGQRENDHGGKVGDDVELLHKLHVIDKMVEEKLATCHHLHNNHRKGNIKVGNNVPTTDGSSLQEPKKYSFDYRLFDMKLIDVDKEMWGLKGNMVKYNVLVACGNYNGLIGFAKAKAPDFWSALEKAYEECFQNLHYVERHKDRTIHHPVQAEYKSTKIFVWPAPMNKGIKSSRKIETVLRLAGFLDIRSKVVGCKTPYNSLNALFKALGASRIPRDNSECELKK